MNTLMPRTLNLLRASKATMIAGLLLCFIGASPDAHAQELDCQVSVIAPTINNVEASVFEQLETAITEFMSGRRWTQD